MPKALSVLVLWLLAACPPLGLAQIVAQSMAQESTLPPHLEQRARALFREIRCPVCDYQSIDDSPAELAQDLRGFVRQQLARGMSDQAIRARLAERYGDYILFRPSLTVRNWLLWLTPIFAMLFLLWLGWRFLRRPSR